MLIWLNGPFGVGKTQTAHELHRRLPGSFICDPEHLGFALHRMTPPKLRGDFQDAPLWREGTRRTLAGILMGCRGVVIVPMTVVVSQYHEEIVGALREAGFEVHHVTLLASHATLLRRLRGRGEGRCSYGAQQIERCLGALEGPTFAEHLNTDGKSIEQVAEHIAAHTELHLKSSSGNRLMRITRRLIVQWGHIRRD